MERTSLAGTNTLVLYYETQTFTLNVYEHLSSLARFSESRVFFAHQGPNVPVSDLALFDVVIIHYSIRLPFNQIAEETAQALEAFGGLKVLFIQDEYDNTHRAWHWIKRLGIKVVFSSVPQASMQRVYPAEEFPGVRFVSNLTGFAPEALAAARRIRRHHNVRSRLVIADAPCRFAMGRSARTRWMSDGSSKRIADANVISHDIAWDEDIGFMAIRGTPSSHRAGPCSAARAARTSSTGMGRSRAGSLCHRKQHPRASDQDVYNALIAPLEMPGLMNQVSPRIFEAIACRTPLVLFDGQYSDAVLPDQHYIALRRDGSNMKEVISRLREDKEVDAMVERAYADVLASGRFGHRAFVRMVDDEIAAARVRHRLLHSPRRQAPAANVRPLATRSWPKQHQIVPERLNIVRLLLPLFPRALKDFVKNIVRPLLTPPE